MRFQDAHRFALALIASWSGATGASAQAFLTDDPEAWATDVRTEYTVSLHRARSQMVDIRAEFLTPAGLPIDVRLPVWRPGRYEVLDPAGTVVTLRATDPAGRDLPAPKTDKATWRIDPRGAGRVAVRYEVYANSISNRTRHADDTHAFLSPSSVFVYTDQHRPHASRITIDAPDDWHAVSGLAPDPTGIGTFLAPDYDVLVDSPIEVGVHGYAGFAVNGTPHEILVWGPVEPDYERMAADFGAIVRAQSEIFDGPGGRLPYPRYVFLIHAQEGLGGGTEHLNSTIMLTRPSTFESDSAYDRFLGLVSHEMFHTWNVKRLRPAGITPYDYQRENYTDLLWVAEGTTSYYDDVTLVRARLLDPDRYLAIISSTVSRELRRPGAGVQSLAASSFDAWIKYNASTPNDVNATVSFYTKGALVSLMLDMELRQRTGNRVWLDHVLRDLYTRHPLEAGGFTTADFLASLRDLSGTSFDPFFADYVSGTRPLDLASAFEVAGVELVPEETAPGSYLGISTSGSRVSSVRTDGPGFDAGVQADDRLTMLDGEEVDDLDDALESISPGTPITLTLERRGREISIPVTTAPQPVSRWRLERAESPTATQIAVYESWLGAEWPSRRPDLPAEDPPVPSDP